MATSPHMYAELADRSVSEQGYVEALERIARPLISNRLPVLITLGHIAYSCDVAHDDLYSLISRKTNPYRVFVIRKRNGGYRYICAPKPYLRIVQQWIHKNILCAGYALRRVTEHSYAYAPGSSHVENAKAHLGAKWLIKLDLTRFFESISEKQVYHLFRSFGYRATVAFYLARICTRVLPVANDRRIGTRRWSSSGGQKYHGSLVVGHLPQGAPTSPMLANLICADMDLQISEIASVYGLQYTRYADDMTFSGRTLNRYEIDGLIKKISLELSRKGLNFNTRKTRVAAAGSRQIVTGILVDGPRIRVPKVFKLSLEAKLNAIRRYGIQDHCARENVVNPLAHIRRLYGQMSYIISVEPHSYELWMKRFRDAIPNYTEIIEAIQP